MQMQRPTPGSTSAYIESTMLSQARVQVCRATGSGTMGREAAAMAKSAVSFFPSALLSVDRALCEEGRLVHSRDPHEIVAHVESGDGGASTPNRTRAQETRREVIDIVSTLVNSIG